jgi:hypothetical protein
LQRDGVLVLRDLNSSADAHVAVRGRISQAALQHNDRVRIGDTEPVFEEDAADAAPAGKPGVSASTTRASVRATEGALDENAITFRVPVPERGATGQLSGRRADMLTGVAAALQWVTDLDDVLGARLSNARTGS